MWAGWRLLAEIDALATGDAPDATRRFVWGLDLAGQLGLLNSMEAAGGIGGLLAVCDPNDPCDPADTAGDFVYTYDANGNVGQLIDGTPTSWNASTAMVARYEYDPYGKVTQSAGSYAAANPFRFSTKWFDAETGFGYWGERYDWPELGRWLNRDPIGIAGGMNVYAYCGNEPVAAVDPSGLLSWMDIPDHNERGVKFWVNEGPEAARAGMKITGVAIAGGISLSACIAVTVEFLVWVAEENRLHTWPSIPPDPWLPLPRDDWEPPYGLEDDPGLPQPCDWDDYPYP